MDESPIDDIALARAGLLLEPVRRRLYEFVVEQADAVDRDTAASALGIGRPLAAFHLDRLAEGGLLGVEFRRRSGRTGPGAGRPAKFYRRGSFDAVEVSVPSRRYGLAAELFAEGLEGDAAGQEAVIGAARDYGRGVARDASARHAGGGANAAVIQALRDHGYEPEVEPDATIRLRNCPFHALVAEHRNVICSTNLALLSGIVESVPDPRLHAERRDGEGFCCVALVPD